MSMSSRWTPHTILVVAICILSALKLQNDLEAFRPTPLVFSATATENPQNRTGGTITAAEKNRISHVSSTTEHLLHASEFTNYTGVVARRGESASFAYAFAIWRLEPDKPSSYKGYLTNILIATRILRLHGSQADFILIIKIHFDSQHEALPPEDTSLLDGMRIRVHYLPKYEDDRHLNVYGTMFHKFSVFSLTEYRRVMYLDSDVMPMNNLDYLMEQSMDGGIFRSNILVASNREPANGGLFVIQPNHTIYNEIHNIVKEFGSKLGKAKSWDSVAGWGHRIVPPDCWETNDVKTRGTEWSFWAASADQGFLYHLCKYVLKDCTQILARKIINFGPFNDTGIITEKQWNVTTTKSSPLVTVAPKQAYNFLPSMCGYWTSSQSPHWPGCVVPYRDFRHFTGRSKPWKQDRPAANRKRDPRTTNHLWWYTLVELRDEEGLNASAIGVPLPY